MALALNAATSRDRDRGGSDFAYDPIRDAFSLRIDFERPPADRREFFKRVDRLIKAVLRLEKKRYLQLAQAASAHCRQVEVSTMRRSKSTSTRM